MHAALPVGPTKKTPLYKALYFQVIVGVVLGMTVGHFWPDFGASLKVLGDGFVKLVKMMIGPIVFCTIVSGITSLSDSKEIGKTLLKSMALFYVLTIIALLTGLVAVTLLQPGAGFNIDPAHLDPTVAAGYAKQAAPQGFVRVCPAHHSECLLWRICRGRGTACAAHSDHLRIWPDPHRRRRQAGARRHQLVRPHAVRSLWPDHEARPDRRVWCYGLHGWQVRHQVDRLARHVDCHVLHRLRFFVVVVLGLLARIHGFSMWKLFRYIREELLIVLATSSSEPVLPRLLLKLEKVGCNKGVVGLVLPTGYSFNLDGTAIYLTLASMFIAQACNIHLTLGQTFGMLGVMLLTSKGAAGVTGSGFVALVATLTVMPDLPVAGVALIVGIDRFMSEARALTSTMSNAVACVVVSIWEKACDREVLTTELNQGYATTEHALEEGDLIDATLSVEHAARKQEGRVTGPASSMHARRIQERRPC